MRIWQMIARVLVVLASLNLAAVPSFSATQNVQQSIGDFGAAHNLPEGSLPKILAHAVAGGLASELSGGSFADGALAAGLAEAAGPLVGATNLSPQQQTELQRLIATAAVLIRNDGDADGASFAAGVAASADQYNRQLHQVEAQHLEEVSEGKTEEERKRLRAAACYLVRCAAGVPESDPKYDQLAELQKEGAKYAAEQKLLSSATATLEETYVENRGRGDITTHTVIKEVPLFDYTWGDSVDDGFSSYRELIDRGAGGAQAVGGAAEAAGSVAVGTGLCAAGVATVAGTIAGCGGGAAVAAYGAEDGYRRSAEGTDILFGSYDHQAGSDVLNSFDPNWEGRGRYTSSVATRLGGTVISIGIGVAGGAIVRRIIPDTLPTLGGGTWTVDPSFKTADEAAGVLVNGSYLKNPTARKLADSISDAGKVRVNGKLADGKYMYVVDNKTGNLVFGTRGRDPVTGETLRMPHPTLIGGKNPQVSAAGMVDIRGGKIYSVDNASGHFKPGSSSLQNAKGAFGNLPSNAFHKDFKGYVPFD